MIFIAFINLFWVGGTFKIVGTQRLPPPTWAALRGMWGNIFQGVQQLQDFLPRETTRIVGATRND